MSTPVSMIERMTLLLDLFGAGTSRLTLAELSERSGLPRSTTHRILDQLVALRWLEHSGTSYVLGLRSLELGGLAVAHHEVRKVAAPLLAELHQRTGAVATLAVLDRKDVVFVDRHGRGLSSDGVTRVGGRAPAHATAVGKAMLAWVDERSIASMYGERLGSRTHHTLTTFEALRQDLALVRSRHGLAFDREELTPGSVAVAVAIRGTGRASGAIQLAGDPRKVSLDRLAPYVQEAARKASRLLHPTSGTRRRSRTVEEPPAEWPPGQLDQVMSGIGSDYWI
ncbi:MAG: IclR family transcriptional regulator [Actinomycetota bacterium]|nr:IclR family transcriptional regulator [Actinomycetota bacterium]